MNTKQLLIFLGPVVASLLCGSARAEEIVRFAEIEVDPAQVDKCKAALSEEIETSVHVEPGVLALHAVSDKDNPARIRILERYVDEDAYNAHLQAMHFQKYKTATQDMVKSLKLVETVPVMFAAKAK
jgi:quinol monooxygenase YgiN